MISCLNMIIGTQYKIINKELSLTTVLLLIISKVFTELALKIVKHT